ncbi:MAG: tRNA (adenosine(37)-N6)-threonylcarbamoyltransferase complex dimerization subunit type 1 TsaB [Nitrospira sp.]|nr:tRNA (adenosine(37)-N6)-threonylcarbamoyltransferase complex dimerization subunit type 1 TsaB [Nitrospira sp.]HBP89161.1 tRNA (adenosine(37)-N6)-threonylcarbamoyltransferase complex dimerization subunit type 1 TsaB [Nitrospiraceae bacterium]HNP28055.1 tRNA (adenosine(37)-N6)-threonylcarbamoyltransferase complex dimerization subunit type 1 TsaB [Nitrospirales bacterium]
MLFLALESATSHQSVAVFRDHHLLASLDCESGRPLTPQLITTIDRLLSSVSLQVSDLEGLVVSIGPGTFTGLRVGLATMTAFRLALQIPLVGVSTLEGLAWNHPLSDLPLLSTINIRQETVYWGLFRWEDQQMVCIKEPQIGKITEVCGALSEPTIVLGDGWIQNRNTLLSKGFPLIEASPNQQWPSAKGTGLAGRVLLERGVFLPQGCTPHYIQPSYAEISKSKVLDPIG